jgi:hypothetical protein
VSDGPELAGGVVSNVLELAGAGKPVNEMLGVGAGAAVEAAGRGDCVVSVGLVVAEAPAVPVAAGVRV